jgi:hypothetical protein
VRPITFGAFDLSADNIKIHEFGPGLHHYASGLVTLPGAAGALDAFGDDQPPKNPGHLALSFSLLANPTLDAALDLWLAAASAGRQVLRVRMDDGTIRRAWAKCLDGDHPRLARSPNRIQVQTGFELAEPYWFADAQASTSFTVAGTVTACDLNNLGNAPLTIAALRYTAGAATPNPKLINHTNGYLVQHSGTLSPGNVWEIDLATQTVTLGTADDYANVAPNQPTTQIEMFKFDVGPNDIDFIATGGTPAGTVTYSYRWMYF